MEREEGLVTSVKLINCEAQQATMSCVSSTYLWGSTGVPDAEMAFLILDGKKLLQSPMTAYAGTRLMSSLQVICIIYARPHRGI